MAIAAVKARPVVLRRGSSVEQGFAVIVANCLQQMQDNEAGVAQGGDAECIHQMRVGLRRLRCALRLFETSMPLPAAQQAELAWLGKILGAARDADVLANAILPKLIEACPHEADLLRLRQCASRIARQKRQQAARAVASVRHARLMLGLVGWVEAAHWRESLDPAAIAALAEPMEDRAKRMLAQRQRKLVQQGKRLASDTPEQRHALRIAAKKARYATEFFQSLQAARRGRRYLGRLERLLDALGGLNDAAVADRLLHEIGLSHPRWSDSAAFARGWLHAATQRDLPRVARLWAQIASMDPA